MRTATVVTSEQWKATLDGERVSITVDGEPYGTAEWDKELLSMGPVDVADGQFRSRCERLACAQLVVILATKPAPSQPGHTPVE